MSFGLANVEALCRSLVYIKWRGILFSKEQKCARSTAIKREYGRPLIIARYTKTLAYTRIRWIARQKGTIRHLNILVPAYRVLGEPRKGEDQFHKRV